MTSSFSTGYAANYQNPYTNPFSNTIMSQDVPTSTDPKTITNFTATGRPIRSSQTKQGGLDALMGADMFGATAPNLLPVRFTDNSIISVPVLPHAEPSAAGSESTFSGDSTEPLVKESRRLSLSGFRRKSSGTGNGAKKQVFIIKQMTRGEYLKHYAKDDDGKYIGSEEPAVDCMLNNAEDRVKWGRA